MSNPPVVSVPATICRQFQPVMGQIQSAPYALHYNPYVMPCYPGSQYGAPHQATHPGVLQASNQTVHSIAANAAPGQPMQAVTSGYVSSAALPYGYNQSYPIGPQVCRCYVVLYMSACVLHFLEHKVLFSIPSTNFVHFLQLMSLVEEIFCAHSCSLLIQTECHNRNNNALTCLRFSNSLLWSVSVSNYPITF